jgi:hypothetical protein
MLKKAANRPDCRIRNQLCKTYAKPTAEGIEFGDIGTFATLDGFER